MPGSGKSTLGKQLAGQLGIAFYDLDDYIEQEANKNINDIFREDGETGFRAIEHTCLQHLSEQQQTKVIATGGGTPCFHENIDYMNRSGITVFLDVPLEIIAERLIQQGTTERPLLKDKTPQELLGQLDEHFMLRKPYYRKAVIHLEGPAISLEHILNELDAL